MGHTTTHGSDVMVKDAVSSVDIQLVVHDRLQLPSGNACGKAPKGACLMAFMSKTSAGIGDVRRGA